MRAGAETERAKSRGEPSKQSQRRWEPEGAWGRGGRDAESERDVGSQGE